MIKKILKYAVISLVLLFMYVPVLVLAVYSFTDASNIGAIHAFSFQNYVTLFTTPELQHMIFGSILLAFGSAAIATILGTTGAVGAFYSKKRVRNTLSVLNQVPVVNADVVTGFSICILIVVVFGVSKDTYIPLAAGHVVLSAPFVYLAVVPKLKQMDPSLYEAALDLGATPAYALFKVIIPQIASGILSGFVMAVTLSLDDYFVATYTKPATFDTISTYVVNATKGSQTQIKTALWALSTIIFIIVVAIAAFFIHSHKISSINVKIDNLEMDVNSSQAVNLKITPESADTSDFEISVSDPSLANISGDLEKGFTVNTLSKEGEFSVTAEGNDIKSNSVEINVVDYKKAEKEAAEKAALAEAQKKAEEEKAAAEEAAQQNAEETNAAQSQHQQANESNEKKVWISATGKKYHSRSSCSNMSSPQEVTVSEAEKRGYTPCKKCN